MKLSFVTNIYQSFNSLVNDFHIKKIKEEFYEDSFSIEYQADCFKIEIEEYRQELYVTLYKNGDRSMGINLSNLLNYLGQSTGSNFEDYYFSDEKTLEDSFQKQINNITKNIYENFEKINRFYCDKNFETNFLEVEQYVIKNSPDLFRTK